MTQKRMWTQEMASRITLFVAGLALFAGVVNAGPAARPLEGRRQAIEYLAHGKALASNGQLEQAAEAVQKSVSLAPSPAAYCELGRIYARLGRKDEAREAFEKALELNPEYELAKAELAKLGVRSQASRRRSAHGASSEEGEESARTNVDALQSEVETIQSLRKPEVAPDDATPEPRPLIGRVGLLLPKPPKVSGEAFSPPIPRSPQNAIPVGGVRDQVIPQQPVEIVHEVPAREIVNAEQPQDKRGKSAQTQAGAGSKPSGAKRGFEARKPAAGNQEEGQDIEIRDHAPERVSEGGKGPGPTEGGRPTAEEVNRVAFSEESRAERGSIGYGNREKVALGTFAFHREKADSYRKSERWVEAANEYEQALRLNPNDVETRALLAEALARAGELDAAEAQFDRAIAQNPNEPQIYYRRGNVYRELRRLDLAIGAFRKALELDPKHKFARNNLGVVYMEKGEYAKAAEQFKKVLELDPNYEKALLNLGIIYDDHLQDKQQALKYYERYLQVGGNRADEVRRWANSIRESLGKNAQ
ncbi:MAG: tetratricopeptide repeat protein [Candidatus Hydrogenedentota bacterium]|jgi:tetratricopeptide (TPR) repeat protein|nr:MAG: tetratricopeptide repeat protein [Candidatus Hydrogenedentota bacterium]GIX44173.1 MAG: hypothetical protein KatS3mg130_0581 [Candidatus Sumerlaea sp.]